MLDILYVLRGYSTGYDNLISFKYLLVLHLFAPPPPKKKIPPPTPSEHLLKFYLSDTSPFQKTDITQMYIHVKLVYFV